MPDRLYTVTGQRPTTQIDAHGNVVESIEVQYIGPGNIADRVKIPESNYTPKNVDDLIRARLADRITIANLGETE